MSGVLRLDQTARLFHGGAEMAEAWVGGVRVWKTDPLAQYYGVGDGQITLDLPLHDPTKLTMNASNGVTGVLNRGGAGSVFNASSSYPPIWDGVSGVDFGPDAITRKELILASPASLTKTHMLFAGFPKMAAGAQKIMSDNNPGIDFASGFRIEPDNPRVNIPATFPDQRWSIFEIKLTGTEAMVWINGVLQGTSAYLTNPYHIRTIGRGRWTDRLMFAGKLGRCIAVNTSNLSSTVTEPAVLAARQRLAQQYGITIA